MNRVLTVLLIFVVGAVAALLVLAYFAYVIPAGPPAEIRAAGLTEPVEVGFSSQGTSRVTAVSLVDAMVGLGYAQAAASTWPIIVYRAAATGQLSALVGPDGIAVDERTMQLGMVRSAIEAYASLSTSDRELIDAFWRGVNSALSNRSVLRDPSVVLSGSPPELWEPWHTLAVEKLFAWLGSDPESVDGGSVPARPIRDFLHLHDFDQSLIITSEPPSEPGLFVRYVFGSSALPVLFETSLSVGGMPAVRGACLLGTPYFVAARSRHRAWAFLPEQSFAVAQLSVDSVEVTLRRDILTLVDGSERLVSLMTYEKSVLLGDPDSLIGGKGTFISWPGLEPISDASAWFGLLRELDPAFRVVAGTGVILSNEAVTYMPAVSRRLESGRIVGSSGFLPYVGQRMDTLMAESAGFNPRLWSGDTYSPWAAQWAPQLLESAARHIIRDATEEEAVSYIRNWDQRFDPASIGASIFHTWAQEYYADLGHWPGVAVDDGSRLPAAVPAGSYDLSTPLSRAVERLAQGYGYDLSVWRWEDVNAAPLFFPVLGRTSSSRQSAWPLSRYTPRMVPGNGHPTTPNWSAIAAENGRMAASSWDGWTHMTAPGEWMVRRWNPDVSRGVGTRQAPDEASMVTSLESSTSTRTRIQPVPIRSADATDQTSDSGG